MFTFLTYTAWVGCAVALHLFMDVPYRDFAGCFAVSFVVFQVFMPLWDKK